MVRIDGAYGEAGGQIVRTCLSLSAITGQAVEIANIRAGRLKPGLHAQHLTAVRAAAEICDADTRGADRGSVRLLFEPRAPVNPGDYSFDVGTAGATTLVLQTVALPLALAHKESRLTITGGTHVPHAPPAEYLAYVYAPALRRFATYLDI